MKQVAWFGFRRPLMRAILESPYASEGGADGRVEEIPKALGGATGLNVALLGALGNSKKLG